MNAQIYEVFLKGANLKKKNNYKSNTEVRLAKNKSLILKSDAKSKYTPNQAPKVAKVP